MDKFVGKRLDGRYEIREIIGVGGMAVVYKAYDNVEDRTVAIKILKEEFVSNEEFIRRFKNESKAIAVLSHPNIVKVYDVSFGDLIQYIVMEHIDGITLKEYIDRQGSLRWKDAVYFAIQILKGLQHAHDKGIVHRDVKPQNIMVLPDGTIKVTDFGIARFSRGEQRTITDKAIGSVHYISPEQARGERTDEKADIYSVGVMLYEMITGQLPFQAENAVSVAIMQLQRDPQLPTEINPSIPIGLEQITMRAMQKNTDRRYQSAAEMLCDLEHFKKDPGVIFDYAFFVDDSPTMYVGNVRSATPASQEKPYVEEPQYEVEEEPKKKSSTIPILSGIAVALLIVIAVIGILLFKWFNGKIGEVECPDFTGMTTTEIAEEYGDMYNIVWAEKASDEYAKGEVCGQSITEGKPLKKGATITIYVSTGGITVKIPDVSGKQESLAISELKVNFSSEKINIVRVADEDTQKGCVIKTEPPIGDKVSKNTEITVYISTGKPTKMVSIPDVVGYSKDSAKSKMEKEGLIPEFVERSLTTEDGSYVKSGYVVAQDPNGATGKVVEGTKVTVYISNGKVEFDLKVTIDEPITDAEKVVLEIWVDGKQKATSAEIETAKLTKYTFEKFISTKNIFDATLRYSYQDGGKTVYVDYAELKITSMTGTVEVSE